MRVIKPATLALTSSTVSAPGYSAWSSGTNYSVGNIVIHNPTSDIVVRQYEAIAANLASEPVPGGTLDWLDIGPTTRTAMFDGLTGTVTTATTTMTVVVDPAVGFDTIALIRLSNVTTVTITVTRNGVADAAIAFLAANEPAPYFDDAQTVRNVIASVATAAATNVTVTVVLSGTSGATIGCALLLVGTRFFLGATSGTPGVGIEDYSTKETDSFGNTTLYQRAYADRASVQLLLPTAKVDAVRRKLALYRATPVLFDLNNHAADETGLNDTAFESLLIFGFYESFDVTLGFPTQSFCNLQVQALI